MKFVVGTYIYIYVCVCVCVFYFRRKHGDVFCTPTKQKLGLLTAVPLAGQAVPAPEATAEQQHEPEAVGAKGEMVSATRANHMASI